MKRGLQVIIVALLTSCGNTQSKMPYLGKWYGLSMDDYVEAHITDDTIFSFTATLGGTLPIGYQSDVDSLRYITYDMVLGYQMINDSILVLSNVDFSDTLYRINDSIIFYDEIDPNDTVGQKHYRNSFFERSTAFYNSIGFQDYWDHRWQTADTIYEEEMIIE